MSTYFEFKDKTRIFFTCKEIIPTRTAKTTDYIVEDGSELSDHYVTNSPELSINAVISNVNFGLGNGEDKPQKAYDKLNFAIDKKEPLIISTVERIYKNYFITNLSAPKTKDSGKSLYFTLSLKKVETAVTKAILPKPANITNKTSKNQASQKVSQGKKSLNVATTSQALRKSERNIR